MKTGFKAAAALMLAAVCVAGWLLWPTGGVPILAYHSVNDADEDIYAMTKAQFQEEMAYLADNGYTAVSLQELLSGASLPPKPVVLTFDDGYEDNYSTVLPILERHGWKATVFVVLNYVGQPGYLTWSQIADLHKHGIEIGSHTVNHLALAELSPADQFRELTVSKMVLEENLGRPVTYLAFPFGSYTAETQKLLRQAGYRGACSGVNGLYSPGNQDYEMRRIPIPRSRYGLWEFKLRLLRANVSDRLNRIFS